MAKVAIRCGRYLLDYYGNRVNRQWVAMSEETSLKDAKSQLGHSSPTLTLDPYSHLMNSVKQKAARKLERGRVG